MTYQESLEFIHSLDKFGSRPGLDRVKRLFDEEGDVLRQNFIHVAGTNGKGSVCTMLSAVLTASGRRTGLFISPYVVDFRERIQIDGEMVSKEDLSAAVTHFRPIIERLNAEGIIITEFEFLTVLAFYIFKKNNCDVSVIETGMGGLLDSTNVIENPLCCVLTRIDLDHTAVLGRTVECIARQKCGIIKENGVTVTAAQTPQVMEIIKKTAEEKHNALYLPSEKGLLDVVQTAETTEFDFCGERMSVPLSGAYQKENILCVLNVFDALNEECGFHLSLSEIKKGLQQVSHPARFEKLCDDPIVILDGAHNRNGLEAFSTSVKSFYPDMAKTLIIGMLGDKDSGSLELLKGLFKHVIAVDVDNPRALKAEELAKILSQKEVVPKENIEVIHSPERAFDKALGYGGGIFICGSLYLAGEIRPYLLASVKNGGEIK